MENGQKFNVEEWLKTIDIWDEKYDYLMHDDHWLSSEWSDKCEKCKTKGKKLTPKKEPPTPQMSNTFTSSPIAPKITTIPINNHIIKPSSTNGSALPSTMATSATAYNQSHQTASATSTNGHSMLPRPFQQKKPPAQPLIPVTPIAPAHINTRAFITPKSSIKFNDTYTRSTRQSTRKLLEADQDLINLNETFDLYKSALASTPPDGS